MPSELDRRLDAILRDLTRPGSLFETARIERDGVPLTVFRHAPPSLPDFFDRFCGEHGDREFLVDGDLRLTFAEVHALARRLAASLISQHAVKPGDHIGIAARNSASWVVAYMASLMAGGCATLLNGWWSGAELARGIALAGCRVVFADEERRARLAGEACGAAIVPIAHEHPARDFAGLAQGEDASALPRPAPEDIATILFTSGSTGTTKGAVSDHRAVVHAAMAYALQKRKILRRLDETGMAPPEPHAALACVPLFHAVGHVPVMLQSFVHGRRLVIMPRWDAREAMRLIEREGISGFAGVPLMVSEIATHPERDRFDLSACRTFAAGGSPWPVAHVERLRAEMPHGWPLQAYGLTESNAVGCGNINESFAAKPASAGRAKAPLVEACILGADGAALPAGQVGEIALRSVCNARGYWQAPAATADAFRADGWLLTGDIGRMDEDGYVYVLDRKKDIVIRGGENISCAEVEHALYAHPEVAEACVFALPHARYGEVPAAVVVPRPGRRPAKAELAAFVAGRLAAFKVPAAIWLQDGSLPRLGTQKVDRQAIKARYAAQGTGAITGE